MHFSHLLATLVLLASAASSATAQTANCFKYGKPCPKEFPFCSGRPNMMTCSSAIWDGYLDNYCTVNASQPNACVEKPMCKDFRVDFNDPNEVPIRTKYEGNPEKQPFIIDTANNVAVKDGSLWLNMRWVGPGGTLARVISTRNFHYGTFSARIRISPGSGLVYTWIFKTAADTDKYGDEIDWEFVPGNSPGFQEAQSNYFLNGDFLNFANGGKHRTPKTLDQWHTYTMKYMPNKVEWLIDDVVVRTIESNATFKTPSATGRLFLSIWDTCEMPEGTRNWAGGASPWCNKTAGSEETKKEYRMPVDWVDVKCAEGYSDTKPVLVPKVEGGQVNAGFIPISGAAQIDAKSIGAIVASASMVVLAAFAAMM